MFANIPCIIRSGFDYGYHYPYVNAETGRFATEESLPETILELLETPREYAPRDWVLAHMSCHKATSVLARAIRERASRDGEAWTSEPVPKIGQLNTMAYWDAEDAEHSRPITGFWNQRSGGPAEAIERLHAQEIRPVSGLALSRTPVAAGAF